MTGGLWYIILMKIISWNVNGIRAFYKKPEFEWLFKQKADFICLQETKAHPEQLSNEILNPKDYLSYFDHSKTRKGYSGVVIYAKEKPLKVIFNNIRISVTKVSYCQMLCIGGSGA